MDNEEMTVTPWSSATPYVSKWPSWVSEGDAGRVAAYQVYRDMYWSEDRCLPVVRAEEDGQPLYVPRPKTVVDTTAHYLLKGLTVSIAEGGGSDEQQKYLESFLVRENFYGRFNVAKLKGVAIGDWIFHITANPNLPVGRRISLTTIDPSSYFPEHDDPYDPERVTGVKILEFWAHPDDPTKQVVKILRYWYDLDDELASGFSFVYREEALWEIEGWHLPKEAKLIKVLMPVTQLPVTQLPVYHFKNAAWDGYEFGNSELKGVERMFLGLSQALSDEEIALALVGLGVYATDAGRPIRNGQEVDWVVSPGTVLEVPGATMIKRLEGISTVTPVQDHLKYLDSALFDATQTSDIALGRVDAQVAESGIALAIKFSPTASKLEYRDQDGLNRLNQLWYDLKTWFQVYDGISFEGVEILCQIGEKLPVNRTRTIEELNNFKDRHIISVRTYRAEVEKRLGYSFPKDEGEQIRKEIEEMRLLELFPPEGEEDQEEETSTKEEENKSNNARRPNESGGTEIETK